MLNLCPEFAMPSTLSRSLASIFFAIALSSGFCAGANAADTGGYKVKAYSLEPGTPEPSAANHESAVKAAKLWLDGLGTKGLVITDATAKATYEPRTEGSNAPLPNYIRVNDAGFSLTIGFREVITPAMSTEDLQRSLDFVAQNSLLTPGLSVDGWDIRPQTPSSHISGSIAVVKAGNGTMTLRLKPEFFALYGHQKGVEEAADAPSPEFSYFQIRQPVTGDITLTLDITNWK